MEKTRIIYLHGFGSTGQSGTVEYLRKQLPDSEIIAPDIDTEPFRALKQLRRLCRRVRPDLIIGTSQGAMYAMQMRGCPRICVNPALRMSTLKDILKVGTFPFFQPRSDGKSEFTITPGTIRRYRLMERLMYLGLSRRDRRNVYGLFGDADTTVNFREEWDSHFPEGRTFDGEHRMNNRVIRDTIAPLARTLLPDYLEVGDTVEFRTGQVDIIASRMAGCCTSTDERDYPKKRYKGRITGVHDMTKTPLKTMSYTIVTTEPGEGFYCSAIFPDDIIRVVEKCRKEK